jgi:hypothetical protein
MQLFPGFLLLYNHYLTLIDRRSPSIQYEEKFTSAENLPRVFQSIHVAKKMGKGLA